MKKEVPVPGIIVPQGCHIYAFELEVDEAEAWESAAKFAHPCMPPHKAAGKVKKTLVVLNYTHGDGSWDKALVWGDSHKLIRSAPRDIFAIGKKYRNLDRTLGINPMYVIETTGCTVAGVNYARRVGWRESECEAYLHWVAYDGQVKHFFVFEVPLELKGLFSKSIAAVIPAS